MKLRVKVKNEIEERNIEASQGQAACEARQGQVMYEARQGQVICEVGQEQIISERSQGQTLLEVLLENDIKIASPCHGNGTCGKCKVRVLEGSVPITEADRRSLTQTELEQGIRLACKVKLENVQCVYVDKRQKSKPESKCESKPESKQESKRASKPEINREEQQKSWSQNRMLSIEILGTSEEDILVEGVLVGERLLNNQQASTEAKENASFFIAIDIGTTTIAMALVNEKTGEICDTYTSLNHQRKYGADVISRIVAANDGKAEELKKQIQQDLWNGISKWICASDEKLCNGMRERIYASDEKLCNGMRERIYASDEKLCNGIRERICASDEKLCNGIRERICVSNERAKEKNINKEEKKTIKLSRILIAGNTTMIHLLMGYSCESLGKYPFYSEHLKQFNGILGNCTLFEKNLITEQKQAQFLIQNTVITILPGISAFVGADVVADVLACPEFITKDITLLIDLGTNGEMVLGNKERLLVSSTAAGPAFEGGNISCGTASIPGSICQVKIQNQRAIVRTIKEQMPPVGVCGSGLISIIAGLKRNKLVNGEGNLRFPYDKNGYPLWSFENGEKIVLTQKDIREFQMAKAAIRAGVEILLEEYGCKPNEINKVYIAGGFGKALNIEDVLELGILPKEFKDKMEILGNGVLQGEILLGTGKVSEDKMEEICNRAKNVWLSQNMNFQKKYMEYMEL